MSTVAQIKELFQRVLGSRADELARETHFVRRKRAQALLYLQSLRPTGEVLPPLEEAIQYVETQRDWIGNYEDWQVQGYPVGSGLVERAVAVVINLRMKTRGMRCKRANTNTAHHRVYGQTRARFGLGAQLAICARAKAMEATRAVRTREAEKVARWRKANARRQRKGKKLVPPPEPATCPQFGSRSSIRYDARTYRLLPLDRVSLNTIAGRVTARLLPGQRQREMLADPAWEIGGAELVWCNGSYFLHLTQSKEAPDVIPAEEAIGVDLGLVNIATDSTGEQFTGASVRAKRSHFVARRAALQRVGTRSAKRRLHKMSGRERRYMKHVNHKIAKTLVEKAVVSRKALALEDLTGIRDSTMVRREHRYERHSWAFFQLRLFLAYKAAWAAVEVRLVEPAYTSQTCSRCGYCAASNRQSQSSFLCQQCGFCCHADYNAAVNISLVARQAANGSSGTSLATSPRASAGGS